MSFRRREDRLTPSASPDSCMAPPKGEALLAVKGLSVSYPRTAGASGSFMALNDIWFDVSRGETLGIVGESGCGKTTLVRALSRLVLPSAGSITIGGIDVLRARGRALREFRRQLQIVFQDPRGSLDPRMRIRDVIAEPLRILHPEMRGDEIAEAVIHRLRQVGLPASFAERYPHECSGGQCQRVGIARAIIVRPSLIICDEAVSALDMSIQAQIVNLLLDLQEQLDMAILFISHNVMLVRHMSHRIGVIQKGRLVELGPADRVCDQPSHPYTQDLIRNSTE